MANVHSAPKIELGGKVIANKQLQGEAGATLLTLGQGCMLVGLEMHKGYDQNGHTHFDHESIGYVVSGKIEMRVGTETHILGPGSTWYHPRGVEHTSLALEDSIALEFHAPLRADVLELFDEKEIEAMEGR